MIVIMTTGERDRVVEAFGTVEGVVQDVLPNSNFHDRYSQTGEVAMAFVFASDTDQVDNYSPFNTNASDNVSHLVDNSSEHPDVWTYTDKDKELFESLVGGQLPENMGRFVAYALAKINTLAADTKIASSFRLELKQGHGKVGFAGGQRIDGKLLAVSGLWEVHDHIVCRVIHDLISSKDSNANTSNITDTFANKFAEVARMHEGQKASDISRDQIPLLLQLSR